MTALAVALICLLFLGKLNTAFPPHLRQGAEFGQKLGIVMLGGIVSSTAAFFLFERKRYDKRRLTA